MMEIVAKDLKKVLSNLVKNLKNTEDENSSLIFFDKNKNSVFTCDGDVFICNKLPDTVILDFDGGVDGKVFYKLIDKCGNNKIVVTKDDGCVKVVCGKSVSEFVVRNFSGTFEVPDKWKPIEDNFRDAIKTCSYALGNNSFDVKTISVHVNGNIVEASDGFKIIRYQLENEYGEFFIAKDCLKFLNNWKFIAYELKNNYIFFRDEEENVFSARTAGVINYPDLKGFVESYSPVDKIVFPEMLYSSLEKASIFKEDENELDRRVEIIVKKNKLVINSVGDTGRFKESFDGEFSKDFSFRINPAFFLQILEKDSGNILIDENVIEVVASNYKFLSVIESNEE